MMKLQYKFFYGSYFLFSTVVLTCSFILRGERNVEIVGYDWKKLMQYLVSWLKHILNTPPEFL